MAFNAPVSVVTPVTPKVLLSVVAPVTPKVPAILVLPVPSATVNAFVSTAIPPLAFNAPETVSDDKVPVLVISPRFDVVIIVAVEDAPASSLLLVLPTRNTALFVEGLYAICPSLWASIEVVA